VDEKSGIKVNNLKLITKQKHILITALAATLILIITLALVAGLYLGGQAYTSTQIQINTPPLQQSLAGQVWMQFSGGSNISADIQVLKQAHATTALIFTGTTTLTSHNIKEFRQIWLALQEAGLKVAFEWDMEGGWGQALDPIVTNYTQANPQQGWAQFADTFINTSNPPTGSQTLGNGTLVVPLETHFQYYVYQFYSPSRYTWLFNETHLALQGKCVSAIPGCQKQESGPSYQVAYGAYHIYYNSTGLYLYLTTRVSKQITYNLHWITFDVNAGSQTLGWCSLFYTACFNEWMDSWVAFLKNITGYVNYETQDYGGFPSYDANPGIIAYLESTYKFNFTFAYWGIGAPNGLTTSLSGQNITQSEFLYYYENYLLMSRFAQEKQALAHKYGVLWTIDNSDGNTGVQFELPYTDAYMVWWSPGSYYYAAAKFSGYGVGRPWMGNISGAIGLTDFEFTWASPSWVAQVAKAAIATEDSARPQGTYLVWAWEGQNTQIPTQTLQALAYWDQMFEEADGSGRYLANIGATRYIATTVYLNASGPFYEPLADVNQLPTQLNGIYLGYDWLKYLGTPGNVFTPPRPYVYWCPQPPYEYFSANGIGTCPLQSNEEALPYFLNYTSSTHKFYVSDVFSTYVFEAQNNYYVLLANNLNTTRAVDFTYYNLPNSIAYDITSGEPISNNTNVTLQPLNANMIIIEPQTPTTTQLIYTNATTFTLYNNSVILQNQNPSTLTTVIQSQDIQSFTIEVNNQTTISVSANTNNSIINSVQIGPTHFYRLSIPNAEYLSISAYTGGQTTSSTTTSSTTTSSTTTSSTTTSSTTTSSTTTSSTTTSSTTTSSTTTPTPPPTNPTPTPTQISITTSTTATTQTSSTTTNNSTSTSPEQSSSTPTQTSSANSNSSNATAQTQAQSTTPETSQQTSSNTSSATPMKTGSSLNAHQNSLTSRSSSLAFRLESVWVGISLLGLSVLIGLAALRRR
jgi:hypothetical protein